MIIDLGILAAVALFGYLGWRSGTIKQLGQWMGLVVGRAVGKPLALILTLALAPDLGIPPASARVGISVLCFYTFYVLGAMLCHFLLRRVAGRHIRSPRDRLGGLLLGLGKGAVILFVLLSVLIFFEKPLVSALRLPAGSGSGSWLLSAVRRRDYFGAGVETRDWTSIQKDPRVDALLKDKRLRGPLRDPLEEDDSRDR